MSAATKLVAHLDMTIVGPRCITGAIRKAGRSIFVEIVRTGRTSVKHIPAEQTFAFDVKELGGLIRVLQQAEREAVDRGLLK